jgi:predicted MFS family arabinose efflux permease
MTAPAPAPNAPAAPAVPPIVRYFLDFGVLRETRIEYWGIQIINLVDCTFYFAMLTIASVFLSEDLGMNDTEAGRAITVFTVATTLLLTVSGMFTDWLGPRRSVHVTMGGMLVLRGAMVVVGLAPAFPGRGLAAAALFLLMAPFMAGVQTLFQSATQRFTTRRSRSAGFNLWYLFMNIGAAAGGFSIDIVRQVLGLANVHIFTMGVGCAALCWITGVVTVRREEQLTGPGEAPEPEPEAAAEKKKGPLELAFAAVSQPAMWRVVVLVLLIVGVRAVFTYLYLLMPKYWLRTIGPDAAFGTLNAINPIGIVIGLILFIPIANRFRVFSMLVYGAAISAFALFPMAVPWEAWWGMGIADAHYAMAIVAMAILTIGEVVWSPKLNEYTAAIAPKGQEGIYLGVSMIPWFLAKTVVSYFSGPLLERWSPETVTVGGAAMPLQQALIEGKLGYWDRPEAMWLLLGLWALAGCFVAWLLRRWFTQGVQDRPAAGFAAAPPPLPVADGESPRS